MNQSVRPVALSLVALPLIAALVIVMFSTMEGESGVAQYAAVLGLAYLIGSIPWGYMLMRFRKGQDIREYGSGRMGMSNVLRTGGGKMARCSLGLGHGQGNTGGGVSQGGVGFGNGGGGGRSLGVGGPIIGPFSCNSEGAGGFSPVLEGWRSWRQLQLRLRPFPFYRLLS